MNTRSRPEPLLSTIGALLLAVPLCAIGSAAASRSLDAVDPPTTAADLQLADTHAAQHRLQDYRGQVVLVSFWATWCTPCVREMPSMQRLADALSERGLVVLAVNVAEPVRRVQAYLDRQKLTFTALLDPESTAFYAWQVIALPTSFLIDRAGRLRFRVVGELDWDDPDVRATIERLLDEPTQ